MAVTVLCSQASQSRQNDIKSEISLQSGSQVELVLNLKKVTPMLHLQLMNAFRRLFSNHRRLHDCIVLAMSA